jgi:hypothetical protein
LEKLFKAGKIEETDQNWRQEYAIKGPEQLRKKENTDEGKISIPPPAEILRSSLELLLTTMRNNKRKDCGNLFPENCYGNCNNRNNKQLSTRRNKRTWKLLPEGKG